MFVPFMFPLWRKKKERKKSRTIIFFLSIRMWSVSVQGNPSLGLWIPHRGFQIPGTGFQPLTVELQFRIPNPRIPDFTSKHFLDSRIQIPFYGVSVANKLTKNLFISLSLIIHLFILSFCKKVGLALGILTTKTIFTQLNAASIIRFSPFLICPMQRLFQITFLTSLNHSVNHL